ncbi:MAG TPA: type 1 glutamine amidotransferase domain-containing protein [Nitrososphaerales archaeon]|nr:type 1 glutamine amidotransferase domain-containing protein [Nitrososphaerales archaeon]
MPSLTGKRVGLLVENLYEDLEFWYPYYRMKEEGADVIVIGTGSSDTYRGKHGLEAKPKATADKVTASDLDAIIIPGGFAPDYMRRYPSLLKLVKDMNDEGKLVAAICHAGWVLVSAGIAKGRSMTCYGSIRQDVINAGAAYVDEPVVKDRNLITSRYPADLPVFCREIIAGLSRSRSPSKAH